MPSTRRRFRMMVLTFNCTCLQNLYGKIFGRTSDEGVFGEKILEADNHLWLLDDKNLIMNS